MKNGTLLGIGGLLVAMLFIVGCETTAGVGRDVEAAGEGIEEQAERHQGYGDQSAVDDQAELD